MNGLSPTDALDQTLEPNLVTRLRLSFGSSKKKAMIIIDLGSFSPCPWPKFVRGAAK